MESVFFILIYLPVLDGIKPPFDKVGQDPPINAFGFAVIYQLLFERFFILSGTIVSVKLFCTSCILAFHYQQGPFISIL
ncbi:MAG: hypothetical protein KJ620_06510 [Candidatus Edwardsbacteria bacterium]|nr:hypothetical protein [Candidatus Edwardsbacteria bacterium]MBU1576213.1 hypothetical protein [Candidatus Edwardsbacteria bacterium]MBU2594373.1 hypothetical protein [Candidatus Edwardsbacteria bacterium]